MIKELREERNMQQKELADLLGVSRQTIYYLEKGTYTPKLTLSLNIARIFEKPTDEIFFLVPVIQDVIESVTLGELDNLSKETGISKQKIEALRKITNQELNDNYSIEELKRLSQSLGYKFESLFEE
ncbi:MAG: helix-turn-helix transcriptional regulator [Candidatus Lokiarchaeota archaeon]|nr:helix-turn-helix transcriptional regulator [Candidatus Lokiarchaeota archaeon]